MINVLLVVYLIVVIALVGIILIQKHDGGGALGMGGSASGLGLFSGRAAGNFITRLTVFLAALFMIISLAITIISSRAMKSEGTSILDQPVSSQPAVPVRAPVQAPVSTVPAPVPAAKPAPAPAKKPAAKPAPAKPAPVKPAKPSVPVSTE